MSSHAITYTVCIPHNFHPSRGEAIQINNETLFHDTGISNKELFPKMLEYIKILKEGGHIWYYGEHGINPQLFHIIVEICNRYKYILSEIDNGGTDIIQGVLPKVLKRILEEEI